jgi:glycosyltransferase involved in cell wall biosynthesis
MKQPRFNAIRRSSTSIDRILIDCSSTITCEFNSGIQRVVRSVCQQATANFQNIEAIPVRGQQGNYFQIESLWPERPRVDDWVSQLANSSIASNYRNLAKSIHKRIPSKKFQKLFLPEEGHSGIFKLPRSGIQRLQKVLESGIGSTRQLTLPIGLSERDVLLLADASWQTPNWECVETARERGAWVGYVIYDLIPLTHPHYFEKGLVERFTKWFQQASVEGDFFLCISECVAQQMQESLVCLGYTSDHARRVCRSFPLGSDLKTWNAGTVSENFKTIFQNDRARNPHFVVGTLEPRKNHSFILDAFDKLWQTGSPEKLCIAGRIGWNCVDLVSRIQEHREFNKKLFLCKDASDGDVGFGYEKAKSLIMASHTEGFGLPIVEALACGQTVLASDTPIHREVGTDRVRYFRIDGGSEPLVEAIRLLDAVQVPTSEVETEYSTIPWSESYRKIVLRIEEIIEYLNSEGSMLRAG